MPSIGLSARKKSDRMRAVTMTIQYDHCFSEVKNRKDGGVREIPRGSNV